MMLYPDLKKVINQVSQVGTYMWERGWVEGSAGNISVNVSDVVKILPRASRRVSLIIKEPHCAGRIFLVTAAGSRLRDIAYDPQATLLVIRVSKKLDYYSIMWGGTGKAARATSEIAAHLQVHGLLVKNNRKERVVLHAHPLYTTALTHIDEFRDRERLNQLLWSMHPEIKMLLPGGVGVVPYYRPGTKRLGLATCQEIKKHRVIIWEKHGCLAVGEEVMSAFDLIHIVEKAAQVFFACRSAGYKAQGLGSRDIEELQNRVGNSPIEEKE